MWDLSAPAGANPLRSYEEHPREVYSVAWNLIRRDCFLSASWDFTSKARERSTRPSPTHRPAIARAPKQPTLA